MGQHFHTDKRRYEDTRVYHEYDPKGDKEVALIQEAESLFFMDRTYEDLRTEVFELDRATQGRLVEEIEEQWTADIDDEAFAEAARRMEAYRRGESTTVSAEESLGRVKSMIEEYKQSHK